jgi:hypothetical protein
MLLVAQQIEVFGGTISVFYEQQFVVANDGVLNEQQVNVMFTLWVANRKQQQQLMSDVMGNKLH